MHPTPILATFLNTSGRPKDMGFLVFHYRQIVSYDYEPLMTLQTDSSQIVCIPYTKVQPYTSRTQGLGFF